MKVLCQSKNIDLIVHYGDDVPEIVTSDYYSKNSPPPPAPPPFQYFIFTLLIGIR